MVIYMHVDIRQAIYWSFLFPFSIDLNLPIGWGLSFVCLSTFFRPLVGVGYFTFLSPWINPCVKVAYFIFLSVWINPLVEHSHFICLSTFISSLVRVCCLIFFVSLNQPFVKNGHLLACRPSSFHWLKLIIQSIVNHRTSASGGSSWLSNLTLSTNLPV